MLCCECSRGFVLHYYFNPNINISNDILAIVYNVCGKCIFILDRVYACVDHLCIVAPSALDLLLHAPHMLRVQF